MDGQVTGCSVRRIKAGHKDVHALAKHGADTEQRCERCGLHCARPARAPIHHVGARTRDGASKPRGHRVGMIEGALHRLRWREVAEHGGECQQWPPRVEGWIMTGLVDRQDRSRHSRTTMTTAEAQGSQKRARRHGELSTNGGSST